ncbi:lysozyme inhibitor LprI family protein [Paracoccus aminovorans]|uniref:lysozyme inhibitor LprI family protein n=1 Tax=Paracoccus aminovorans TaxID=34004 RepID=UPI002B263C1D|nr:lysozyme inhibitor LprI family protein [Paracoccus aminovorans]
MRLLVFSLLLAAGPALAQDGPQYDAEGFAKCVADAEADLNAEAALRTCIGQASTLCMATPGGDTTVGMVQCLDHEAQDWDKQLNRQYDRALKAAKAADAELAALGSAAEPAAPALQQAQHDWVAFRDSSCRYESLRYQGGTLGGPAAQDCVLQLTAQQALRLRNIAESME